MMSDTAMDELSTRQLTGPVPGPAVHVTELSIDLGNGAGGVAVSKATEIVVGHATVVVLEWADGIISVGSAVEKVNADRSRASGTALRHALERGETLRLRWASGAPRR